jgi:hypothetical protein
MFGLFAPNDRPRLLVGTIKLAAVIAFISLFAGQWLADGAFGDRSLARVAAEASRPATEPTMTGSIGRAASGIKIDPCGDTRKR